MPQISSSNPVSGASTPNTQPWLSVGQYSYNGPNTYVKIYLPVGQSTNIIIRSGSGVCSRDLGDPTVDYYIDALDNNEGMNFGYYNIRSASSRPGGCGDLILSLSSSQGIKSDIIGHSGYAVFGFYARLVNPPPGFDYEKLFRLESTNASSFIGASKPIKNLDAYNDFGIYRRDIGTSGSSTSKWGYQFEIAPNCNSATTTGFVRIRDADYGLYNQGNDMYLRVYETDRGGSTTWGSPILERTGAQLGGNGVQNQFDFTASASKKYLISLGGFTWPNTVQINVPFDQFNAMLSMTDCGPDLCKNLPGKQTVVPSPYLKDTPGTQPGNCYISDRGRCQINIAQAYYQYENVSYSVSAWNTTGSPGYPWRDATKTPNISSVYVSTNPNAPPGSYAIFADPGTKILPNILNANTGPSTAGNYGIDTNTPGTYTVNVYLYEVKAAAAGYWQRDGSCTATYTVYPATLAGDINVNSCSSVTGRLYYSSPGAYGRQISGYIKYVNPNTSQEVTRQNIVTSDGINELTYISSSSGLKPYLNYGIELWAVVNGSEQRMDDGASQNTGICMTIKCQINSPTGNMELGLPYTFRGGVVVYNQTNLGYGMYSSVAPQAPVRFTDGAGAKNSPPVIVGNGTEVMVGAQVISNTLNSINKYNINAFIDYGAGMIMPNDMPIENCSGPQSVCTVGANPMCVGTTGGGSAASPYVKAYNADVAAGGGFDGSTCAASSRPKSGIFTYMVGISQQPSLNKSGSGSQLAAYAWDDPISGDILGFATAALRPNSNLGYGLAFSGNPTVSGADSAADIGGNLIGAAPCIPDYYNETQFNDPSMREEGQLNIVKDSKYKGKQVFINTNTSVGAINNFDGKTTFYVKGDVNITQDITYRGYASVAEIPNLTIIALGNIYVHPRVTRLDGVYIAQPNGTAGTGRIYTCSATGGADVSSNVMYNQCSGGIDGLPPSANVSSLRVNGAFIAQKVVLNRVVNYLGKSTYKENPSNTQAAEVFNFSPEVYLSPPLFKPKGSITSGDYDAIGILPPIL